MTSWFDNVESISRVNEMALFVGAMEVSLYALGEGILVTFVFLYSVIGKSEETCFGLQKK